MTVFGDVAIHVWNLAQIESRTCSNHIAFLATDRLTLLHGIEANLVSTSNSLLMTILLTEVDICCHATFWSSFTTELLLRAPIVRRIIHQAPAK